MIGLATPFLTNNYGTKLQAFALQTFLTANNYDNEIINYTFQQKQWNPKKLLLSNRKEYKRISQERQAALSRFPETKQNIDMRNQCFAKFTKEKYVLSDRCDTLKAVSALSEKKYCSVICGSDQIWLPSHALERYYMLDFLPPSVKRIAYAPSFGVSSIPRIVRGNYRKALKKFHILTARENMGAELVKELTGRDCPVVVDPTLLLDAEQWVHFLGLQQPLVREKYVLVYFIGATESHRRIAKKYAQETGAKLIILPNIDEIVPADTTYSDIALYNVGPDGFVNLIQNAEAIFTDSFHASVFSIIFQKTLFCFERFKKTSANSTNSRIYSLLSRTGLEDRLITDESQSLPSEETGYDDAMEKVAYMRAESIRILREALQ